MQNHGALGMQFVFFLLSVPSRYGLWVTWAYSRRNVKRSNWVCFSGNTHQATRKKRSLSFWQSLKTLPRCYGQCQCKACVILGMLHGSECCFFVLWREKWNSEISYTFKILTATSIGFSICFIVLQALELLEEWQSLQDLWETWSYKTPLLETAAGKSSRAPFSQMVVAINYFSLEARYT